MPKGFPLKPTDASGNSLSVGVTVEICSVESCAKELPGEDQKRLFSLVGCKRTVLNFDKFGFVWLSFSEGGQDPDFSLFPVEIRLVR